MQAIILAGGFGTRLKAVIGDIPKPLAPINGEPFLRHLLDHLVLQGFNTVVLSVYYQAEEIKKYFGDNYKNLKIIYALEKQPLGTGGAIKFAYDFLPSKQEPFFVINGDTFLAFDAKSALQKHHSSHQEMSILITRIQNCTRYGTVKVINGVITDFLEKADIAEGLINAGIYILSSAILEKFPDLTQFSFELDFLQKQTKTLALNATTIEGFFIDIGIPEDYEKAQQHFKKQSFIS